MVSNERAALIDFMAQENTWGIGKFIASHKKLQADLLEFNSDVDINLLIEHLQSKGRKQKQARIFLDDYLEARSGRMPMNKLPLSVRLSAGFETAKEEFRSGIHNMTRGSMILGAVDLTAAALSSFGLTKRERQLAFGVGTVALMSSISSAANATVSQEDVTSRIHDFNRSSYSEAIVSPDLTVTGNAVNPNNRSDYKLSPFLIKKLETNPQARQLVLWIVDAASKNGLDPVLYANQLFRESMHFKPSVIYGPDTSPAGAMGIAQFMPYNGAKYGLNSDADFFNPEKQIYAAARMMSDLTAIYDDQCLAMAAFNGGRGSIEFVKGELNTSFITCDDWLEFMDNRYEEIGETSRSAWHVETREYIGDITGQNWGTKYTQWAVSLQGNNAIQYLEGILSGSDAIAAINSISSSHAPG